MRFVFCLCLCTWVICMNANAAPTTLPSTTPASRPAAGAAIRLWPDRAPRSTGDKPADIPEMYAYLADTSIANGCAVVICPGGGYMGLSMKNEGTDEAKWFNDHGVSAFILKYRVYPYGQPCPLLDGQRAIRTVRFNSKAWGIDWRRIGIMGFSAGGHVASSVGTHFDPYIPGSADPINGQSCRPDFMILVYPLITMKEKITHAGSRHVLLGDHPPQKLIDLYSNELQVRDDTPPTFIVASVTDKIVPVKNSQLFADALKVRKIPYQYLELPTGDHGFGMAFNDPKVSIWTDRCLAWMNKQGYLKKK
jgi:acetyl esterase/lipase